MTTLLSFIMYAICSLETFLLIQLYNRNNVKTFFAFAAPWWLCDGNKPGFNVWGGG